MVIGTYNGNSLYSSSSMVSLNLLTSSKCDTSIIKVFNAPSLLIILYTKEKFKKNAYIQYFSDGIELCDC